MSMQQLSAEENLKVLYELIFQEEIERETLAADLHHKIGGVAAIKMFVKLLETETSDKKTSFRQLENAVDITYKELRVIMDGIYPRNVQRLGLIKALLDKCDEFARTSESKFNLFTPISQPLPIQPIKEVVLFKVCINILEFFSLVFSKEIEILLTRKGKFLVVQIAGHQKKNTKFSRSPEASLKLSFVKARLLLLQASVMSKTNWKDIIAFKMKVED